MSDVPAPWPDPPGIQPLARRVFAEFLGTAAVAAVVVGSGIVAQRLSPGDVGLQLLEHTLAVATGIGALIVALAGVSGAHFNPLISLADWALTRWAGQGPARGTFGLTGRDLGAYVLAQVAGGLAGTWVTHATFGLAVWQASTHARDGVPLVVGEVIATGGLLLVVLGLNRTGQSLGTAALAVPGYIAAAIWFTSSACFINPALTLARSLTDTFTGIAPHSVPGYLLGQVIGAALGAAAALVLYPDPRPIS
ncbi:MAG: aquaporin [Kineosporiaceae bacterium]